MSPKHVAGVALISLLTITLVARVTMLKTLVGFQAAS